MPFPEKTTKLGQSKSVIRELAAYGVKRKLEIGPDNVYDFSLGNPSIPSPEKIKKTYIELLNENKQVIHGYTAANGIIELRKAISENINKRFNLNVNENLVFVSTGCASALIISMKAITFPGDEIIIVAPYFPEYKTYVEGAGAKVVEIKANPKTFEVDLDALSKAINKNTRAIIINSPNNPTGKIYSSDNLKEVSKILKDAEEKYNRSIYIISDEPYRELIYNDVPYVSPLQHYNNSIMCYSWSKSLSLPGERIGYIAINDKCDEAKELYTSVLGAARCLGYVSPPSLVQFVMAKCIDDFVDPNIYKKNRDALYEGLSKIGYEIIKPEGAFYLFVKALEDDANKFSERAKKYELLLVPSDGFGVKGYVRISYCVMYDMICNSLPKFKELFDEYNK